MILDMIQGCRYLWRSTDRWFISKNSTTRLKDSKVGTGPICCEIVRSLLQTLRVHIYTLVLTRLLVDHEYNIYCLNQFPGANVRLAPVINSSRPYIQATSSRIPECFLFRAQNSSSVEWWRAPNRRHLYRMLWGKFPTEWYFFTKLGPQVSLFPVPIFGVNTLVDGAWQPVLCLLTCDPNKYIRCFLYTHCIMYPRIYIYCLKCYVLSRC
jgi:hypothetical protein